MVLSNNNNYLVYSHLMGKVILYDTKSKLILLKLWLKLILNLFLCSNLMKQKHLGLSKIQKMDLKFHQLNIKEDSIEKYLPISNKKKFY